MTWARYIVMKFALETLAFHGAKEENQGLCGWLRNTCNAQLFCRWCVEVEAVPESG